MSALYKQYTDEEFTQIGNKSVSMKDFVLKLGYTSYSGDAAQNIRKRVDQLKLSDNHFIQKRPIKRDEQNIFILNSTASQAVLRRGYFKGEYTPYKCSICGQKPFGNNKPLTLTLDYINGIHSDNRLENLRGVCPNCDRQLDTFGSKNKYKVKIKKNYCLKCGKEISKTSQYCPQCAAINQRIVERPDRETFKKLVYNNSFTELGRQFHVSDTSIKKGCVAYKLPKLREDIKKYSFEEGMKL